ncbi:flavodoxin family protein [Desulfosporosinus youngiae]|uniref:Multimeric flavodoxin WrbA n=1 Tax=Desulfosporosinus youngiae DSM 17734 TaxID=768710 RepID=H5Y4L4_9FIRM|nr:NAD(P)H-dependent oxidoreductase [Desulfosporosinus youngiae]EHQ89612.1 multimeric flavodoxin WrbA [Desulfosporosinus youngiae DSM 17734]
MKIAIVYFSKTGNTKKVADLIAEGAKKAEKVEVKAMSIEEADYEFLNEAKTIIVGTPTIAGTFSWQIKQWLDTSSNPMFAGKLGAVFATANYVGGGAEVAELALLAELLVKGMLVYSSGAGEGQPFIHYGPVCIKDGDAGQKERAVIFGERVAKKTAELFR